MTAFHHQLPPRFNIFPHFHNKITFTCRFLWHSYIQRYNSDELLRIRFTFDDGNDKATEWLWAQPEASKLSFLPLRYHYGLPANLPLSLRLLATFWVCYVFEIMKTHWKILNLNYTINIRAKIAWAPCFEQYSMRWQH